jgi:hypothetical protein
VTPPTILRVLSLCLVATHAGLVGVVIEKILSLFVIGMDGRNVVVHMAVSAVLLLVFVAVIVVTGPAVILHASRVGRMIEDHEPTLAVVYDAYRFLRGCLCIVVIEGDDAHDETDDEKQKRDLIRPVSSHGSFLHSSFFA